ncbi:MAG: iron ABC transporter permease [Pseudomonadota bacterium]
MSRAAASVGALACAVFGLAAALLAAMGEPLDWAAVLAGTGIERELLLHFRLPRVLTACLTGAVLGLAGTALQVVLRNPLASPDVIGFGAGAGAGAAVAIIIAGSLDAVLPGALLGGALATALILSLAWRGGLPPNGLIIIGVALSLMLTAATDVLLSFSPGIQAAETARFLTGSFAGSDWQGVALLAGAAAAGGLLLGLQSYTINRLDLGDDIATAQGLNVRRTRGVMVASSAALISVSVAATGPLPFLAFLAGPLARAVTGVGGTQLGAAALTGALIALGADALARSWPSATTLPAGVFTAALGGLAMLVIVLRQGERRP